MMPFYLCRCLLAILLATGLLQAVSAVEFGLDVSYSGGGLVDNWGVASHIQAIGSGGFGLDLGYQHFNSLTYDVNDTSVTHSLGQLESAALWQRGNQNFRFQALAGGVFSNASVQLDNQDVMTRWSPGYKVSLGVSVPVFSRFRAFAESGYQGWFSAETPGQLTWRYGVRVIFGRNTRQIASNIAEPPATNVQTADQTPAVTIDPEVPKYIPGYLSQSLPPIVRQADLCKCYPAGPYTLQLGEFRNMPQAIRALEYRGLRQFFNSRAYQKSPQPVFLAQLDPEGAVSLYLGELDSIEQMQHWRYELRKSGMQARFRKVVGTGGERIPNPTIVAMDEQSLGLKPKYTPEEIRRMNSLPDADHETKSASVVGLAEKSVEDILEEKTQYEAQLTSHREQMNQLPNENETVPDTLQIGPLSLDQLQALLMAEAMKGVLSRSEDVHVPSRLDLVWDEAKREAWLTFGEFSNEQHIDEWDAWFNSLKYPPRRSQQPFQPMGDVYYFSLAQPLEQYSVEIAREADVQMMLQQMRSPEVLWFQAYQRINNEPVNTSLNWSMTDQRYHLIVVNVASEREQQSIWSNLNAVGLLPGLAEE